MSLLLSDVLFWLLSAAAVAGALLAVFGRELMRTAIGLGFLLLSLAGLFAYYGFGFLALAELFVYVGGVLVLFLFAIMLVHRTGSGVPALESKHSPTSLLAAAGVSALLFASLMPMTERFEIASFDTSPVALGTELLGRLLPQFELAGLLLLVALVAVVAVLGGERE